MILVAIIAKAQKVWDGIAMIPGESGPIFEQQQTTRMQRVGAALLSIGRQLNELSKAEIPSELELRSRGLRLMRGETPPDYVPDWDDLA